MPPDELVRVLVEASRVRDADVVEQLQRRRAGRLGHVQVDAQAFGDLLADLHHRVERRHRILEDHRHFGAPDGLALAQRHGDQLLALEEDRARPDGVAPGQQAHDRARQDGLAGAGLADDAERPAPIQRERRRRPLAPAASGVEMGAQVGDLSSGPSMARRRLSLAFTR